MVRRDRKEDRSEDHTVLSLQSREQKLRHGSPVSVPGGEGTQQRGTLTRVSRVGGGVSPRQGERLPLVIRQTQGGCWGWGVEYGLPCKQPSSCFTQGDHNHRGGRHRGGSAACDNAPAASGLPNAESWCRPHTLEAGRTFLPPENLGLLNTEQEMERFPMRNRVRHTKALPLPSRSLYFACPPGLFQAKPRHRDPY